ncbi:MAG: ribonuclease E/G [Candidatus Parvarchaeota archaeon]|jgi:hypothetical protein|nr:ribonuclease E/G [Candidatus Parvarchaeota archaeon]
MKVKVRGVYSTAITKILVDAGIEITQAADAIKEVFKISSEDRPDVVIEDIESREGVYIFGTGAKTVVDVIKKQLEFSIFYKEEVGKIYCGIIKNVDQKSQSIVISLPDNEEGTLDMKSFWGYVKQGSKLLVQAKGSYDGKIMLSNQLRLFGDDVILIKNGFTKISRGIRSSEGKDKLYEIAKGLNLKDWGILWMQGAEDKDESTLKDELLKLQDEEKRISADFEKATEPSVIYQGLDKYFVLVSRDDKYKLDEIRSKAMPTVKGHHSLKSAGYTILTDLAETMLDKYSEGELVSKIGAVLSRYGPIKDKMYRLNFARLNGTSFKVDGIIRDMQVENNEVKSITLASSGSWDEKIYQISADREYMIIKRGDSEERMLVLKPEIFPKFAKFITMDIYSKRENGEVTVKNEDRLKKLADKGEISKELFSELEKPLKELREI